MKWPFAVAHPDPGNLKLGQIGRCRVNSEGVSRGLEAGQERYFEVKHLEGGLWVIFDESVYMKWAFTGGTYMRDCNPQFFNANFDIVEAA